MGKLQQKYSEFLPGSHMSSLNVNILFFLSFSSYVFLSPTPGLSEWKVNA